jgi:Fic family protein
MILIMSLGLNNRQNKIILELQKQSQSIADLQLTFSDVKKITLNRDLKLLLEFGLIEKTGQARATKYQIAKISNLLVPINVAEYFKNDIDERKIKTSFNLEIFQIFKEAKSLFTEAERKYLEQLNLAYKQRYLKASKIIRDKELERFTIELSWKSSKIEGNTYSILDTEALIKSAQRADNKSEEEALMILNHKEAFDYIFQEPAHYNEWSLQKILELHSLLMKGLGIENKPRSHQIAITGTNYKPLDNQWQIEEVLNKFIELINQFKSGLDRSLATLALLSYIQAFEDGNKRTSRLAANACLLADGYSPLSFRSIDENEYKKAVLLFYEQNNLSYLKQLFIEQFEFAASNYLPRANM